MSLIRYLIRGVLFDLDGVIVFTDRYHYSAWKKLCDERGWSFDEQMNHRLRGIPRMESLQIILDHNKADITDKEKNILAEKKNEYYREFLKSMDGSDICPGALDFLKALKARGIKLGLCSSSKNAGAVLEKLGLVKFFDAVVTGNDIKNAKPHPEIFMLCAQKLGIPPFHCIVFEDAFSGIEAANAAGMKSIGVGSAEMLTNAAEVIRNYKEIDTEVMLESGRKSRIALRSWSVTETSVEPVRFRHRETIFALSNGYIGLRGTHEEDDKALEKYSYPGMYINGIYGYETYNHLIAFPGFPARSHRMINLCDWRIINFYAGNERFSMLSKNISGYRRELDLKKGILSRYLIWESPSGKKVEIRTTRFVSMARRHSAAIRYEVKPLNFSGSVTFESIVKTASVGNMPACGSMDLLEKRSEKNIGVILYRVKTAPFMVAAGFGHLVNKKSVIAKKNKRGNIFTQSFRVSAKKNERIIFDKHACFYTNVEAPEEKLAEKVVSACKKDMVDGFDSLYLQHSGFWQEYWDTADIEIAGNVPDQAAVRFNLFHLRQSHPEDNRRSIGANGLTGDIYSGHIFWDTEMYILPHFLYVQPQTVRSLLMYRYNILGRARERAGQMEGKGALFSWNSISGEECGVVYEAATAQYHLLSDIAFAIWHYVKNTNDVDFLYKYGAEILFETARFFADRGAFILLKDNKFCINTVCGPDEYGCGVNNNCYTNMMAQWHFRYAVKVYAGMEKEDPAQFSGLAKKIGLKPEERRLWQRAADNMYIPFNKKLGIHEQDDSFLYRDPVNLNKIPLFTDIRAYKHPLNLWRMQMAKQSDVVLLMFVLGDKFSKSIKRKNYEFYEPRTNHGSSLSPAAHSIIASETGKSEDAYIYFRKTAYIDIDDFKNNAVLGVHSAALGGTWMAVVNGFAGMRDYEDSLQFNPVINRAWESYRFKLNYKTRILEVMVAHKQVTYKLLTGEPVDFYSSGKKVRLSGANPQVSHRLRPVF